MWRRGRARRRVSTRRPRSLLATARARVGTIVGMKVLITGCSSGFGLIFAKTLAGAGHRVFATMRDVAGKNVLILDDIVDTAGTLTKTVDALAAQGARRILAAGVHGILSGPALQRIEQSKLELVLITNTTPVEEKLQKCSKLKALSVAPLLGEAIRRIHENSSVSSLFV